MPESQSILQMYDAMKLSQETKSEIVEIFQDEVLIYETRIKILSDLLIGIDQCRKTHKRVDRSIIDLFPKMAKRYKAKALRRSQGSVYRFWNSSIEFLRARVEVDRYETWDDFTLEVEYIMRKDKEILETNRFILKEIDAIIFEWREILVYTDQFKRKWGVNKELISILLNKLKKLL